MAKISWTGIYNNPLKPATFISSSPPAPTPISAVTRQILMISGNIYQLHLQDLRSYFMAANGWVNFGFGHDNMNKEYGIVKIVRLFNSSDGFQRNSIASEVHVYSSKSNSWRRIQDFPYSEYLFGDRKGSCFVSGGSITLVNVHV
ncbi:hypothetical protein Pint_19403 [Pistacia integerrima]|uniref:Uncharacterized protein n=1 Tax=Pistacia integerrima TaxID=434235 RepID=A0ACC0Z217_9ROSI|nr:hypothetical protein Pint_19403 [Pistacia integerrima]